MKLIPYFKNIVKLRSKCVKKKKNFYPKLSSPKLRFYCVIQSNTLKFVKLLKPQVNFKKTFVAKQSIIMPSNKLKIKIMSRIDYINCKTQSSNNLREGKILTCTNCTSWYRSSCCRANMSNCQTVEQIFRTVRVSSKYVKLLDCRANMSNCQTVEQICQTVRLSSKYVRLSDCRANMSNCQANMSNCQTVEQICQTVRLSTVDQIC